MQLLVGFDILREIAGALRALDITVVKAFGWFHKM